MLFACILLQESYRFNLFTIIEDWLEWFCLIGGESNNYHHPGSMQVLRCKMEFQSRILSEVLSQYSVGLECYPCHYPIPAPSFPGVQVGSGSVITFRPANKTTGNQQKTKDGDHQTIGRMCCVRFLNFQYWIFGRWMSSLCCVFFWGWECPTQSNKSRHVLIEM